MLRNCHLFIFSTLKFFKWCPLILKVSPGHLTPIFNILLSALCSSSPHLLPFDWIPPPPHTPFQSPGYLEQRTTLQAICPILFIFLSTPISCLWRPRSPFLHTSLKKDATLFISCNFLSFSIIWLIGQNMVRNQNLWEWRILECSHISSSLTNCHYCRVSMNFPTSHISTTLDREGRIGNKKETGIYNMTVADETKTVGAGPKQEWGRWDESDWKNRNDIPWVGFFPNPFKNCLRVTNLNKSHKPLKSSLVPIKCPPC